MSCGSPSRPSIYQNEALSHNTDPEIQKRFRSYWAPKVCPIFLILRLTCHAFKPSQNFRAYLIIGECNQRMRQHRCLALSFPAREHSKAQNDFYQSHQ